MNNKEPHPFLSVSKSFTKQRSFEDILAKDSKSWGNLIKIWNKSNSWSEALFWWKCYPQSLRWWCKCSATLLIMKNWRAVSCKLCLQLTNIVEPPVSGHSGIRKSAPPKSAHLREVPPMGGWFTLTVSTLGRCPLVEVKCDEYKIWKNLNVNCWRRQFISYLHRIEQLKKKPTPPPPPSKKKIRPVQLLYY